MSSTSCATIPPIRSGTSPSQARPNSSDAGTERWDAYQLPEKPVNHPRWIQKYRYEVLLRLTNFCSGLCRYCYLKNRENVQGFISHADIDQIFDALEQTSAVRELHEIVLSGGDPLTAPGDRLIHLAERIDRLNQRQTAGRRITVTIHTREPVWFPSRIMRARGLLEALQKLRPSSYILHVVHPREVTPELLAAMATLVEIADCRRPLMMTQHPLFRGINDDARIITDMYDRLDAGPAVVKPYYLIHPFPDGTLPQHRLTLRQSQKIVATLVPSRHPSPPAHRSNAHGQVRHRPVGGADRPGRLLSPAHQGRRPRRIHHRRTLRPQRKTAKTFHSAHPGHWPCRKPFSGAIACEQRRRMHIATGADRRESRACHARLSITLARVRGRGGRHSRRSMRRTTFVRDDSRG